MQIITVTVLLTEGRLSFPRRIPFHCFLFFFSQPDEIHYCIVAVTNAVLSVNTESLVCWITGDLCPSCDIVTPCDSVLEHKCK